jgi:hypothetical protein
VIVVGSRALGDIAIAEGLLECVLYRSALRVGRSTSIAVSIVEEWIARALNGV